MLDMQPDFLQTLTLLLIGLLFFKENILGWFDKKFGIGGAVDDHHSGKQIPEWAQELIYHYNHDTTELLKEIRDSQKIMCRKIDEVVVLLENQKEYGVKILKQ